MISGLKLAGAFLLVNGMLLAPALAQVSPPPVTGPVPAPGVVETQPLPPLTGAPVPDAKPGESKPAEAKPAEAKPGEIKPAEAKPAEAPPAPTTTTATPPATPSVPAAPSTSPAGAPSTEPPPAAATPTLPVPPPPAPVQALPGPGTAPAPAAPQVTTVPAVPSAPGLPTLAPGLTEQNSSDEVELVAKKAASLKGSASWENGYTKISEALMKIRAELLRAGIKPAGKPIAVFLSSDDENFQFEAMIPVDPATEIKSPLGSGVTMSQTPAGKTFRFGHKGAYDSIDDTYEVLTAYLDAKGVEAKEQFIEEYITEDLAPLDENFTLHIYVQPK